MATIQARSRLKNKTAIGTATTNNGVSPKIAKKQAPFKKQLDQRSKYWPLLLLSALTYFGIFLLLRYVYPSSIQNCLFANSYLPLQIMFFLGNFFSLTFISLNKKIGLSAASFFSVILFLHLQQVHLDHLAFGLALIVSSTLFWLLRKL